ncbi:hypothetical protein PRZ48_007561 [Zasmidium cellare]|uniref:PSI domain-containing protein n=1 Tax=Zasmidium cellare TaxID=395010 RepID=A0ABR0EJN5_ZASCE|nr:hypothetical protein PRZ48_007561 [Zasmidium cellare]
MALTAGKDRFEACWRIQDCGSCINDKHSCGWCPFSSTCVPVSSLVDPVSNGAICPLSSERFELRTKALGCGCSTTTLLSVIVTVFATIAALALLFGIGWFIKRVNPVLGSGTYKGTEIEVKDDGTRDIRQWERDNWRKWLYRIFARPDLKHHSEQEEVTERSRLLG